MSDRLISADVLKSSILQWQFKIGQDGIWYVLGLIDSTPTIEAEPIKHGHWRVTHELESWDIVYCSECGEGMWNKKGDKLPNYCYNCGANMDEEVQE